jgi:hypothetical protein
MCPQSHLELSVLLSPRSIMIYLLMCDRFVNLNIKENAEYWIVVRKGRWHVNSENQKYIYVVGSWRVTLQA